MSAFPQNPVHPAHGYTCTEGTAIAAFTVNPATVGDVPLIYGIAGEPAGVDMNPRSRLVTG